LGEGAEGWVGEEAGNLKKRNWDNVTSEDRKLSKCGSDIFVKISIQMIRRSTCSSPGVRLFSLSIKVRNNAQMKPYPCN
jgi:hypothetical protein